MKSTIEVKEWLARLHGAEFKVMMFNDGPADNSVCDNPEAIVRYLREQMPKSPRWSPETECLAFVALSARRKPVGFQIVTNGSLDTILITARELFRPAIVLNAAAIIVAHNHPSGDPTPSDADIKVTRDLVRAGQLLKIEVLDHVILGRPDDNGGKGWASLRELGYF